MFLSVRDVFISFVIIMIMVIIILINTILISYFSPGYHPPRIHEQCCSVWTIVTVIKLIKHFCNNSNDEEFFAPKALDLYLTPLSATLTVLPS